MILVTSSGDTTLVFSDIEVYGVIFSVIEVYVVTVDG